MMHRKFSEDRLLTKQSSFLAQQRQALYKNPVPINAALASTSSMGEGLGAQHSKHFQSLATG